MAAEATLNDINAQLKEQNKGDKKQTAVLLQIASSLAGPSASQLAEEEQKRKPPPGEGGGGGGMGGGALKGIMGIFKSIGGFIKKLKAGLLFLLLPAVLTFINSEHFQKALNIINEVLLPALKKVWNWIKLLFSDPMAALEKLWDGIREGAKSIGEWIWNSAILPTWEWLKGIFVNTDWGAFFGTLLTGITNIGQWIYDKAIAPVWEWLSGIVENAGGWGAFLWGLIKTYLGAYKTIGMWIWNKAIKPVWDWLKGIFVNVDWGVFFGNLLKGITNVGQWIYDKAIKPAWEWLKGIFVNVDWGAFFGTLLKGVTNVGQWIYDKAIKPAWEWLKGIFVNTNWGAFFGTLLTGVTNIGKWVYDKAIAPVFVWLKGLFVNADWGAYFGTLIKGLTNIGKWIYDKAIAPVFVWLTGLFVNADWGAYFGTLLAGVTNIGKWIYDKAIKPAFDWLIGIFVNADWGKFFGTLLTAVTNIGQWIYDKAIKPVWDWITGLFGFGDDDKPAETDEEKRGIMGVLSDLASGVWTWFKDLFDFSSASAAFATVAKIVFLPYTALFDLVDNVWKWFKKKLGFTSKEADDDPRSGSDKVIDFVVTLPGKIWDWLKKTVLGWFGIAKVGDELVSTVDDADKPEAGWISKLFASIFPYWLLHPVDWAMQKLGLKDAEGKLTASGDKFKDLVIAEGGIGAAIAKIFSDIFPEWITSPIVWIKKKLGLGGGSEMPGPAKDTWKFPGFPTINDLKEFLPKWLTDPIGWVKGFFGGGGSEDITKKEEEIQANRDILDVLDKKLGLMSKDSRGRDALVKQINELATLDSKLGYQLEDLLNAQGRAKGGQVMPTALSIVGEKGPEFFIPKSRGTVIPSDVSQTASLLAMGAGGGGGGGSVTNVSINAPTNSTTTAVSNLTDNVTGASDPYVAVAGAFG